MSRAFAAGLLVLAVAALVAGCHSGHDLPIRDIRGVWVGDITDGEGNTLAHVALALDSDGTILGGSVETPGGTFDVVGGGFDSAGIAFTTSGGGAFLSQAFSVQDNGNTVQGNGTFTPPGGGGPVDVTFVFHK
ncbi:MAG: hypothetical protein KKI08_02555 [Armatimonadetes bacterium]|nr:hypothetical protein [Armatimonadota bacterium]